MRRFLLGILVALLTLGIIVGGGMLLADKEPEALPQSTETAETVAVTEETVIAETEPVSETEPEKRTIDTVPLYYQTDYPYIKFGYGTMATSGCSVTCLAMVATYMTDHVYTPEQMAYHFGEFGIDHVERLDHGLAQMQIPYQKTYDIRDLLDSLESGKIAIAMMNEESYFTNEQHFIVLAGINEAGKIIVNDPYEPNYTRFADVNLKDAYENGFMDYHLRKGFTGAWLFDKKDMPEDPFLFDASLPEQLETRYRGYTLTEEDADMLTRFVMVEAGKESPEVQQAVAEVVLNRMVSKDHPKTNTVYKVIYATELQRAVKDMAYAHDQTPEARAAVEAAVYGPYVLPEDICFYSAWTKGNEEWGKLGSYTFYKTS